MKKKILAFFFALHIFCFSLVYCFCCPVYAVGEEVLLFEGFQSLMFILGLSADLSSGITQSQWVTKVDSDFTNAIAQKSQEQQDILNDNYAEFKDNLQHGYMLITDTLFDFFKDTAYSGALASAISYNQLNSAQKQFITSNASRYSKTYFIYASPVDYGNTRNNWIMWAIDYSFSNGSSVSIINPPDVEFVDTVSQTMKRYTFATCRFPSSYGVYTETHLNSNNSTVSSGLQITDKIQCVNHWRDTSIPTFTYNYLGTLETISYLDNLTAVDFSTYDDIIDDTFVVGDDGYITTTDGVLPQVLDDTTIGDLVDDVKTGQKSWASAIGSITDSYPENPAMPEDTLTLPELDQLIADLHLERLQSKFPFCIPHDIQLIYSGATAVSANAPVLVIPIDITFKEHTYFHDDEFITIDFSMFDSIIPIFREGFFLLFLVGLLWVSIHILQAFFVVTE